VDEENLSLAIGRRGQNARLTAKLTGWEVDVEKEEVQVVGFEEKLQQAISKLSQSLEVDPEVAEQIASTGFVSVEGIAESSVDDLKEALPEIDPDLIEQSSHESEGIRESGPKARPLSTGAKTNPIIMAAAKSSAKSKAKPKAKAKAKAKPKPKATAKPKAKAKAKPKAPPTAKRNQLRKLSPPPKSRHRPSLRSKKNPKQRPSRYQLRNPRRPPKRKPSPRRKYPLPNRSLQPNPPLSRNLKPLQLKGPFSGPGIGLG
jgi:hypothetical protein